VAKCGALIAEDSVRCFDCGIHFSGGTAFDFVERRRIGRDADGMAGRLGRLLVWVLLALVAAGVLIGGVVVAVGR
jgi:hypothetical protein